MITLPARLKTQISVVVPRVRAEPIIAVTEAQLQNHVDDTSPHPAYDDLPSLSLIFENGLV